jgi:PAS domain S-box-containing protein
MTDKVMEARMNPKRAALCFEKGPLPKLLVNPNTGRIEAANEQAKVMFGYSYEEFYELEEIEALMPERFRERHRGYRRQYAIYARPRQMGANLELFALNKAGIEIPVEILLAPIVEAATDLSSGGTLILMEFVPRPSAIQIAGRETQPPAADPSEGVGRGPGQPAHGEGI